MSIVYSADVFCDSCGYWVHGTTRRNTPPAKRSARTEARKQSDGQGWTYNSGNDYCFECTEARRRGEER